MTVLFASWVLALLTIFTLSFSRETRLDLRLTRVESDRVASRALARSGVTLAEELLRHAAGNEWDSPVEGWDRNPGMKRVAFADGYFSVGYATGVNDTTTNFYGVQDEGRRISLQDVGEDVLTRLDAFTPQGARTLVDFVPQSGEWRLPAESVPGLDEKSRRAAARYLTAHPNGGVNINTASPIVLTAIGIPPDAVASIVQRRNGRDGKLGTRDDQPFTSVLLPTGGLQDCRLSAEAAAAISLLARKDLLAVRSDTYRIRSRGWLQDRNYFYEIETVVKRLDGDAFEVLDWRETWIP